MRGDPGKRLAVQFNLPVELDPVFREVSLLHLGHDILAAQPAVEARERADRAELGRDHIAVDRFEVEPQESGRSPFGCGERQFLRAGGQHRGRGDQ